MTEPITVPEANSVATKIDSDGKEKKKVPSWEGRYRDHNLAKYRRYVAPVVHGISHIATSLDVDALDENETEDGIEATSSLAAQYGMEIDARIMFALWVLSLLVSRIPQWITHQKEKAEKRKRENPLAGVPTVK